MKKGGTLLPLIDGLIPPTNPTKSPLFTEEKMAKIRTSKDTLLRFYKTHQITDLPKDYVHPSSRKVSQFEYRGVILADLFVSRLIMEGRITGGSQPTSIHRLLSSSVNTTVSPTEARRFAVAKANSNYEYNYAELFQLTHNEVEELKRRGFFKPVVLEFDRHKIQQNGKRERRNGTGINHKYTKTQPYLFMSELSDGCLEQLRQATGFDFLTGAFVEDRPLE